MRRVWEQFLVLLVISLSMVLPLQANQGEFPLEVEGLDQLWDQMEHYGVDPDEGLDKGLESVWKQGISLVDEFLRGGVKIALMLLAVVFFCGMAEGLPQSEGLPVVTVVGALAVTGLSIGEVGTMIYLGQETIEKMNVFSTALLPVMTILTTATGGMTAAVARQGSTVLFAGLLITVIHKVLVPLIYAYLAVCCANAAVGHDSLKKIGDLIKSTVIGFLTSFLLVFVGYLTVSGSIAGSADLVAIRTTKIALSRAVPVVGGILSDAAETVLVGAGVLRGTVGVAGMLSVLAICTAPFLELGVHYMTYKMTAALAGTVANSKLSGLIDHISSAFGLILGMTGACALLLLVSLVISISSVVVS